MRSCPRLWDAVVRLLLLATLPAAAACEIAAADVPIVPARAQTEVVRSAGDAADDPAIWVNPETPERSLVLGTDKQAGVHVYGLDGRELQFLSLGETNNIDVRSGFPFADAPAPIVAVSNRSDTTVVLLRLDASEGLLHPDPVGRIPAELGKRDHIYGVCLHHDASLGRNGGADGQIFHVAITSERGAVRQWRLSATADASVAGTLVRSLEFDSKTEGCAFDDGLGVLYVSEEDVGLWRLPADPEADDGVPRLVDRVAPYGNLQAHVEGVDIYALPDGTGFVIVSSQGKDLFHLYRREGRNEFVGGFRIGPSLDGTVDGVTHTDGVAVTSAALGPEWPLGLLVVQDHRTTALPRRDQNFKLVAWEDVLQALGL